MKEQLWYVGRYLSGFWVAGGNEQEYKNDTDLAWYGTVNACTREEAIKKAKSKYYNYKARQKR